MKIVENVIKSDNFGHNKEIKMMRINEANILLIQFLFCIF